MVFSRETPLYGENETVRLEPHIFLCACDALQFSPTIDLFALSINTQLPRFIAPFPDEKAVGVNAFNYCWTFERGYANPPWTLIPNVLRQAIEDQAQLMIVVPEWPHAPWYKTFQRLMCRSIVLDEPIYLTPDGHLRPKPKWDTRIAVIDGSANRPCEPLFLHLGIPTPDRQPIDIDVQEVQALRASFDAGTPSA